MALRVGFTLFALVSLAACNGITSTAPPSGSGLTYLLNPGSGVAQDTQAQAVLRAGGVVVMKNGSVNAFDAALGSHLPHRVVTPKLPGARVGNNNDCSTPFQSSAAAGDEPRIIAARLSARHDLHVLYRFDQPAPARSDDVLAWYKQDIAQDTVAAPDSSGWTQTLQLTTENYNSQGDVAQHNLAVYRLNDIINNADWYMLTSNLQDNVVNDVVDGRRIFMRANYNWTSLSEFDPASTVDTSSNAETVGTSVSSNGSATESVTFQQSWSQPDVTTYVTATLGQLPYEVVWDEEFCCGSPSSTNAFYTPQAMIAKMPEANAASFSAAEQMWFNNGAALCYEYLTLLAQPPTLAVSPSGLTIAGGSSSAVAITAQIPTSGQGLPWTATIAPSNNFTLSQSSGVGNASVTVNVEAGTPSGSVAYLNVDTSPQYAAPSVETGPLRIVVNVP